MLDEKRLARLVQAVRDGSAPDAWGATLDYLTGVWLDDYAEATGSSDVVETTSDSFSYLFDVEQERLIAAFGVSRGENKSLRDKSRMAGHPKGAGKRYHRGHAIPHSLGGPLDINLVPQLGSVNV